MSRALIKVAKGGFFSLMISVSWWWWWRGLLPAALVVNGDPIPCGPVRFWIDGLKDLSHEPDVLGVDIEETFEVGPLDLDHDLSLAVKELGAVNLAQAEGKSESVR